MTTKTKTGDKFSQNDLEKTKSNPTFRERDEILEDVTDLKSAKSVKGRDMTLEQYLKKRNINL